MIVYIAYNCYYDEWENYGVFTSKEKAEEYRKKKRIPKRKFYLYSTVADDPDKEIPEHEYITKDG